MYPTRKKFFFYSLDHKRFFSIKKLQISFDRNNAWRDIKCIENLFNNILRKIYKKVWFIIKDLFSVKNQSNIKKLIFHFLLIFYFEENYLGFYWDNLAEPRSKFYYFSNFKNCQLTSCERGEIYFKLWHKTISRLTPPLSQ